MRDQAAEIELRVATSETRLLVLTMKLVNWPVLRLSSRNSVLLARHRRVEVLEGHLRLLAGALVLGRGSLENVLGALEGRAVQGVEDLVEVGPRWSCRRWG